MSLDQPSAIPVDTHMFQIASSKYLPHLKQYKSVTEKVYKEIGDHFRKLYGQYAGWAHSVIIRFVQNTEKVLECMVIIIHGHRGGGGRGAPSP